MTGRKLALGVAGVVAVLAAALVAAAPQPARAQGNQRNAAGTADAMLAGTATASSSGSVIAGFDGPSGSARVVLRTQVTSRGTTPPAVEVVEWVQAGETPNARRSALRSRVLTDSMVSIIDLQPAQAVRVRCLGDAAVKWELVEIAYGGR